jgi:hypothetical protein
MPDSYLDRMVHISDVHIYRSADGSYVVAWKDDDKQHAAKFRTARGADTFARAIDTTGATPTRRAVGDVQRAIQKSETAPPPTSEELVEQEAAYESLYSLEPHVQRREPQVRVRRHSRKA